jgi:hypothetical protein
MKQKFFTLLLALSLMLCVAVCVLWARSYWREEYAEVCGDGPDGRHHLVMVTSCRGIMSAGGCLHTYAWHALAWMYYSCTNPTNDNWAGKFDVRFGIGFSAEDGELVVFVPHAAVAMLSSAPALFAFRRRGRPDAALCPQCNYDLRATPDRCPECGTAAAVGR